MLFRNLIEIGIHRCVKLKSAFPLAVARGLSQLRRIDISECYKMEKVFYTDDDNHKEEAIGQSHPTSETTSAFDTDNDHKKAILSCPTPSSIIRGLIGGRRKPPESVPSQQQVEETSAGVSDAKQVNVTKSNENRAILFPRLNVLGLRHMPDLRVFYDGNDAIELPSLESMRIHGCGKMEALSYGSCNAPILQQILINNESHPVGQEDVNASLKQIMLNREKPDTGEDMKKEKDEVEETENDNDDDIHQVAN